MKREMKREMIVLQSNIIYLASDSQDFDGVIIRLDKLDCIYAARR